MSWTWRSGGDIQLYFKEQVVVSGDVLLGLRENTLSCCRRLEATMQASKNQREMGRFVCGSMQVCGGTDRPMLTTLS